MGEVVFGLLKDPGIRHRGAANHHAAHGGAGFAHFDIDAAGEVAVADDGDLHGLGAFADDIPVGEAGVALGAGAAMDGDGLDAAILQQPADVGGIDGGGVPADADLGGDGHAVSDAPDDG